MSVESCQLYHSSPPDPICAHLPSLRSAEDAAVLAKAGKRARPLLGADAAASGGGRSEFGKSTAVFARLQEQQDLAKAGVRQPKGGAADLKEKAPSAAALRL